MKAAGGKRADFLVETWRSDKLLFVDAEQHRADGGKVFRISEAEFQRYQCLQQSESQRNPGVTVEIAFIVFPKEPLGKFFAMLWLDFFEETSRCLVAKNINEKRVEVPGLEVRILSVLNDSKTGRPWATPMLIN